MVSSTSQFWNTLDESGNYMSLNMVGKNRTKMDVEAHMDRGWAWVILAGCFMCNMLTPGMFWSFGIFLLAWEEQLSDSITDLQWILSLLITFAHLAGKVAFCFCTIGSLKNWKITMLCIAGDRIQGYSNYFLTGCAAQSLKPLPISEDFNLFFFKIFVNPDPFLRVFLPQKWLILQFFCNFLWNGTLF